MMSLNSNPLISIIIPTFNSERTILSCLESIAIQTFVDYEVIIQDGFSRDNTLGLISSFHDSEPALTLRTYSQPDKGVYDAMNNGLQNAKGTWLYFLGSDDALNDPTTLTSVSQYMNHGADVVYGDVTSTFWNGRFGGQFTFNRLYEENICHQSIFVRKNVFSKFGNFCLDFNIAADWEHNMRWFLDPTIRICYINLVIAIFSEGGLSSTGNDSYFDSIKDLLYLYHGRRTLSFRLKASLFFSKLFYSIRRGKIMDLYLGLRTISSIIKSQDRLNHSLLE